MSEFVTDLSLPKLKRTPFGNWLMELCCKKRKDVINEIYETCMPDLSSRETMRKRLGNWRYQGQGDPHYMVCQVIFNLAKENGFTGRIEELFPSYMRILDNQSS